MKKPNLSIAKPVLKALAVAAGVIAFIAVCAAAYLHFPIGFM